MAEFTPWPPHDVDDVYAVLSAMSDGMTRDKALQWLQVPRRQYLAVLADHPALRATWHAMQFSEYARSSRPGPVITARPVGAPARKKRAPYASPRASWTLPEERRLGELAGTLPVEDVTATLVREFGIPRTLAAVRCRATLLGRPCYAPTGYCLRDIQRLFRSTYVRIKALFASGVLPARRRGVDGHERPAWWVTHTDLVYFLSRQPWLYEWRRMRPGHPLTALAEVTNRADPWLTVNEAKQVLGVSGRTVLKWIRLGRLAARQRVLTGSAQHWRWVIRRSDALAFAQGRAA